MNVVFHEDFYRVYASDPAAAAGRLEGVVATIEPHVTFVSAEPAVEDDIAAIHTSGHVQKVRDAGLYRVAARR